jgi:hypothetical protein
VAGDIAARPIVVELKKQTMLDYRANSLLVGSFSPTPLKNMSSSLGMMTLPYGKIKNVSNHQPAWIYINL